MMTDEEKLMFCSEMQEVKLLLADLRKTQAGGSDVLTYWPTLTNLEIPAETTVIINPTMNKTLKYISNNIPDGMKVRIYNDNQLWLELTDDTGSLELRSGVYFGNLRIDVENTTKYPLRWSIKMVWNI
ncbi:hypothetical protein McpSp1_08960 [Methanocorpusculaceae archaeon Sp1]|nr:hypothetical protein [Methanocorpusculaceae archaeon Sp1]